MATETVTKNKIIATSDTEPKRVSTTTSAYPDPEWSHTNLNYYKDAETAPPDLLNSTLSEHQLRQARRGDDGPNVLKVPVSIRNIAGQEHLYNISTHGFCISHLFSAMTNWNSPSDFKSVYLPEVASLLKRETGCKEVFSYEHHIRTGTLETALQTESTGAVDINGPVRRVHIDESPASAKREFEYYMTQLGRHDLLNQEFGIYNVWKPLKMIIRDPLCLCDQRTIKDEDLQATKVQVPNVDEIENFSIRPPGELRKHEFVYVRGQKPEQALVFRIYDGRIDDVEEAEKRSYGVAHSSFEDFGTEGWEARESVEVRSFCVF